MATLRPTLANSGYKNWVKGGLALKFAKEGIENFVERNIDTFHQDILNSLRTGTLCYSCSTENIVQCRSNNSYCKFSKNICKIHDPKDPTKKCRPCPNSVCNVVRDEIHNKHRFRGPSWKNTDSSLWCREPWQLAKCYMPDGYSAALSAADTDFTGLVSVIINNTTFDTEVTDNLINKKNLFIQARAARNAILHKANTSLSDVELGDHITTLDTMLADSKCLAGHPSAIQARTLLQQLLNGTLNVTERDEAEVLAEALRAIDDKTTKAIAAVNKEKEDARSVLESDKDEALTAISKETDIVRDTIKSGKDEALTAISKEKNIARDTIKSGKVEAVAAISKESNIVRDTIKSGKDEAVAAICKESNIVRDTIKSGKDEALTAISNEKDIVRDTIKSGKVEAVIAISKEKDMVRDTIKAGQDEALTAISKEKDIVRDTIKSGKVEAVAAISKEKDMVRDTIKSGKDEALTSISKEKDIVRDTIKSGKDEALTAISKEKDIVIDTLRAIDDKTTKAIAAVNKEKEDARSVLKSDKDEALTAITKERDIVRYEIKADKVEAVAAISKEKDIVRNTIKSGKVETVAAISKEKDIARDKIKSDKDNAMKAVQTEKTKAEVTISSKCDEAVTTINTKERLTISALKDALIEAKRIIKEKEKEAVASLQDISTDSYQKLKKGLKAELLSIYQDGEHLNTPLSPLDPLEDKHIEQLYVTPNMKLVDHRRVQKDEGKSIETYKDIFKDENKKIYIVGEAGMGKTAFCQEIVSTWCQVQTRSIVNMSDNQQAMSNFDFLFYISLRDAITHSCVAEMIKHLLLPNKPGLQQQLAKVIEEERCLVVLDGLDEWTTENKTASTSHVNKGIPGRDSVRNCTMITTTRPWKLEVLQLKASQIDTKVELLGIDKTSSEHLARKMIDNLNEIYCTKKMYEDLVLQLEKKKIVELRLIPVVLKQVICLWHSGKELGQTKSVIYCQMLELFLELAQPRLQKDSQYQQEKEKWMKSSIKLPSCLNDKELCQMSKPLLFVLGKLAFQTLLSDDQESSLVFKSTKEGCYHLSPAEVNICLKIGILCQDKILQNSVSPFKKISFLHKTFQEFLAAMFVSLDQSETKPCVETLQQFCSTDKKCLDMSNVLTFISGLCPSDITCTFFDHYKTKGVAMSYRQCFTIECMREDWTCSHDNKHLYFDYIEINSPSEYLDQLCKVNIPNVKVLYIYSPPTAQCLQYLLQINKLEYLWIFSTSNSPLSEDLLYDLVHHYRHTLTDIYIEGMTLRSNTRLSTLIPQLSHLYRLGMHGITLPQQLLTRLQALDSPLDRNVIFENPTILPDTESTD